MIRGAASLSQMTQLHIGLDDVFCAPPWPAEIPHLQDMSVECCLSGRGLLSKSERVVRNKYATSRNFGRGVQMPSLTKLRFSLRSPDRHADADYDLDSFVEAAFRQSWLPIGCTCAGGTSEDASDESPRLSSLHLSLSQLAKLKHGSAALSEVERDTVWPNMSGTSRGNLNMSLSVRVLAICNVPKRLTVDTS